MTAGHGNVSQSSLDEQFVNKLEMVEHNLVVHQTENAMGFKSGAKGPLSLGRAIFSNLSKLLDTGANADVHFVFKESTIAAHSSVIAASSPVFAAMFQQGKFREAHTKTVDIEDVDPGVFRQLL
jgi:BTB/POZ domain